MLSHMEEIIKRDPPRRLFIINTLLLTLLLT